MPPATGKIDFVKDVQPILTKTCVACHGPEKQRGGLRLDDGVAAMKGGNNGPVLKPGDAAASKILAMVAGLDPETKMPPGDRTPLTSEQIGHLRAWIEQGAAWPKGNSGTTSVKSDHWAFQPIKRPALPEVKSKEWVPTIWTASSSPGWRRRAFAPRRRPSALR